MSVDVQDNKDQNRFEARIDGQVAGFAEYVREGDRITFTHTEVSVEGQGVGSALARQALDAVRAEGGLVVVPRCPFIKGWIEKHPDYQDLL
ncbi:N-acetyltransferase [Nocardioides sp. JQ2195]|uniref:GNAT family N-acetyltransferase n=1 Tax=Nocardioides sp. JQ2195 TaxID=2592334 RepID=UPI00143E3AD8|nr:GNAT family N-acetyltransferase [Nocardioides sp. JQ2195]QIX25827.1 N-acetyltransferase [Nocardioides sp. JQ2195]